MLPLHTWSKGQNWTVVKLGNKPTCAVGDILKEEVQFKKKQFPTGIFKTPAKKM